MLSVGKMIEMIMLTIENMYMVLIVDQLLLVLAASP